MSLLLNLQPDLAWKTYLAPGLGEEKWLESSASITNVIRVTRRELLALILYSYHLDRSGGSNICWNSNDPEPNDGYIAMTNGQVIRCEHKVVSQFATDEVMKTVIETYDKYAKRGKAYGSNRHLIIHANKASTGLARISKLADHIGKESPFDKVMMIGFRGCEGGSVFGFSVSEQFPGRSLRRIRIDKSTGKLVQGS
jgi:hypothetical protein